ncbi:hypothetical protein BU16DRAFT_377235 [Lophium mytilinum]|uniref:Uncharacterized protein n=1 Tax=Lophium mytilinum TaxID=390894 RepID=A0A6A6QW51_9PEZI|nr:hypothetical protein BU16DRAFT_377235 [Lophium mytilinum]
MSPRIISSREHHVLLKSRRPNSSFLCAFPCVSMAHILISTKAIKRRVVRLRTAHTQSREIRTHRIERRLQGANKKHWGQHYDDYETLFISRYFRFDIVFPFDSVEYEMRVFMGYSSLRFLRHDANSRKSQPNLPSPGSRFL